MQPTASTNTIGATQTFGLLGGTVPSGVYPLVGETVYGLSGATDGGPVGDPTAGLASIEADVTVVATTDGGATSVFNQSVVTCGGVLVATDSCPDSASHVLEFGQASGTPDLFTYDGRTFAHWRNDGTQTDGGVIPAGATTTCDVAPVCGGQHEAGDELAPTFSQAAEPSTGVASLPILFDIYYLWQNAPTVYAPAGTDAGIGQQWAITFSGGATGTFTLAYRVDNGLATRMEGTYAATTTATADTITFTPTCPAGAAPFTAGYDVSNGSCSLMLYLPPNSALGLTYGEAVPLLCD